MDIVYLDMNHRKAESTQRPSSGCHNCSNCHNRNNCNKPAADSGAPRYAPFVNVYLHPDRSDNSDLTTQYAQEVRFQLCKYRSVNPILITHTKSAKSAVANIRNDYPSIYIRLHIKSSTVERFRGFFINYYQEGDSYHLARYLQSALFMRLGFEPIAAPSLSEYLYQAAQRRIIPLCVCLGYSSNPDDLHRLNRKVVSTCQAIAKGVRSFIISREVLRLEEQLNLFN